MTSTGGKRDGAENSPKTEDGTAVPDLCAPGTVVDTVTNIRGELFVFKDKVSTLLLKHQRIRQDVMIELDLS